MRPSSRPSSSALRSAARERDRSKAFANRPRKFVGSAQPGLSEVGIVRSSKGLTKEELKTASIDGKISQIGYGKERPYSPTVLRSCLADQTEDHRILSVRCLANFGYSGSPILAEINGAPTVVGVFSATEFETRNAFVCSASQFEEKLKELTGAAINKALEH